MQQVAAHNTLDSLGTTPWHLKLDVQLFGPKDVLTEQGTIEEWWSDADNWRITYTEPSFTGTSLQIEGKFYRTTSPGVEASIYDDILDQVVHPLSNEGDVTLAKPDLRQQIFGKTALDCIMLVQPLVKVAFPPLGLFPTFCLDPGNDVLRISVDSGSLIFARSRVGDFLGRSVPVDLLAQSGQQAIAKAHLIALSTMKADVMALVSTPEMEQHASPEVRVSGSVIAGSIISKVPPIYPERAKQNHVSGSVVLRAIIGRDGRVRSLQVMSTEDSDLAVAALQSVRQWIYTPFLLNGLPTEVDTTVTVNFSMGPG